MEIFLDEHNTERYNTGQRSHLEQQNKFFFLHNMNNYNILQFQVNVLCCFDSILDNFDLITDVSSLHNKSIVKSTNAGHPSFLKVVHLNPHHAKIPFVIITM